MYFYMSVNREYRICFCRYLLLLDIPVRQPYGLAVIGQVLCNCLCKGDAAVLAARAAKGYNQLCLALLLVEGYKEVYQIVELFEQGLCRLKTHDISRYLG